MKIKSIKSIVLTVVVILGSWVTLSAADPEKESATISAKLFTAIEKSDYPAFVADGDSAFKQMTREQFDGVAAKLAPKFKSGYAVSYLGELRQKGYRVTLWKVSFKDGSDDALATLNMKDGKVAGFFIR